MSANIFGERFKIVSFGESHGTGLGVVIDGCPSEIAFDETLLKKELARRRPGQKIVNNNQISPAQSIVSDRNEEDTPEVLSGVFQGKTLGTPIAVLVRNKDARSKDYADISKNPRPGHADDTWKFKFGHVDYRGGGRSSGRETLSRVIGGAFAQMFVKKSFSNINVMGFASQIGPIKINANELRTIESSNYEPSFVDTFSSRCPINEKNLEIENLLLEAKKSGKSYGGEVIIMIKDPPAGLGQPVFHKLKSDLAGAFMSLGATNGVELGDGREAASAEGSEFHRRTHSSHYGGIRGGISTGETILMRIFFKPTATVLDTATTGRHDPCIIPRAIPVLEAMAWLVLADHILWQRSDKA